MSAGCWIGSIFVTPWACLAAYRSNRPDHWAAFITQVSRWTTSSLSSRTKWQWLPAGNTPHTVSPTGNCWYFVLLDKDGSCPTADLSKIGHPSSLAYSTDELLNTPDRPHIACMRITWSSRVILPKSVLFINIMHIHEAFQFFLISKKLLYFTLHVVSLIKIYSMHELFFFFLRIFFRYRYL